MAIKVLLADDLKTIRDELRAIVEKHNDMEVVGAARSGRGAVKLARKLLPDVVVMDITMPDLNGMDATRMILRKSPGIRVIGVSMHSDRWFVSGMLDAGASGFLLKDCASEELAGAIRSVASNHTYLSPRAADVMVGGSAGEPAG